MSFHLSAGAAWAILATLLASISFVGCGDRATTSSKVPAPFALPDDAPRLADELPIEYPGLKNVVAYDRAVFSGSLPDGDAGFDSLRRLGVRTIISVDGALPNLEPARARGMRYVHLPIGYDRVPAERTLELARAIRDLPQPIYFHCHHGKHRSAAAAGAALVTLGSCSPESAVSRMRVSGTSASYRGLYASVSTASVVSSARISAVDGSFPEVTPPIGLVRAMSELERIDEHVSAIQKAGWKVPEDHPDLVPAAEAGRMADIYRNLLADTRTLSQASGFVELMHSAHAAAQALEDALIAGESPTELTRHYESMKSDCRACHTQFRD
ncbi:MAG: hypothetical protein ACKVS9_12535 [Phycisphaerae bacterium]